MTNLRIGPGLVKRARRRAYHPATMLPLEAIRLRLAAFVRDRRIPLEMCPTSNVHRGAAESVETHLIDPRVVLTA